MEFGVACCSDCAVLKKKAQRFACCDSFVKMAACLLLVVSDCQPVVAGQAAADSPIGPRAVTPGPWWV